MFRKTILATAIVGAMSMAAMAASDNCDMSQKGGMGMQKGMHKRGGMDAGMGAKEMMSLKTVKLTAEQKTKIDAINEEFRGEMAKLRIQNGPMMKDPFVVAGGFDKEAFKKEKMEKMQKHLDMQADHLAKIWAVLTPEQQKSIAALAK